VDSWHDCGSPEGLLGTNRHLLEGGGAAVSPTARLSECSLTEPVLVEEDVAAERSVIGPNVTVERGARVVDSRLADTIVGAGGRVEGARLERSLVGAGAVVRGVEGRVNVSDHSVVEATGPNQGG
jgi:glucose-1-phosphate thymidylyltransferase